MELLPIQCNSLGVITPLLIELVKKLVEGVVPSTVSVLFTYIKW